MSEYSVAHRLPAKPRGRPGSVSALRLAAAQSCPHSAANGAGISGASHVRSPGRHVVMAQSWVDVSEAELVDERVNSKPRQVDVSVRHGGNDAESMLAKWRSSSGFSSS